LKLTAIIEREGDGYVSLCPELGFQILTIDLSSCLFYKING